jgi:mRNA-degrading endonuclease RelE of RelBE toxin-antitoxin system
MEYRIEFSARAKFDLEVLYIEKNAADSRSAADWFNGLVTAVRSLRTLPKRCPTAPEAKNAKRKLRHLLYGNKPHIYRVIYEVDAERQVVYVLTIRHGARDRAKNSELL